MLHPYRFAVATAVAASSLALLPVLASAQASGGRGAVATISERQQAVMRRLPSPSPAALAAAEGRSADLPELAAAGGGHGERLECGADSPNPLSPLVASEDNPSARALEGYVLRDKRGRRTRAWRPLSRKEREARGPVVLRPLLVFLETPAERQDSDKPWLGPVRFDRPGFYTSKEAITEQVFGKGFDHRDPASVAGFYFRESGGKLVIQGDASSVHTVLLPHMTFDPAPMVEAILAQLDPIVDFRERADELGWVHPIFVMTPLSATLDVYDPSVMGTFRYLGLGATVYDQAPALTADAYPDGTHAALSALAISMVGLGFGANEDPRTPSFGLPEEQVRDDNVELYAHELGHTLGLAHMFTRDYALDDAGLVPERVLERTSRLALSRDYGSGVVSSVMNYAVGSGQSGANLVPRGKHAAGLDPMNRSKLGWGNVVEVTLADEPPLGPHKLAPGQKRRVELAEHLGSGANDRRPQILKVNLPPQRIALFPQHDAGGNPTGYWRPGEGTRRMVWSGRSFGGSRFMETELRIPPDHAEPVLAFWTKYGSHNPFQGFYPPGFEFGWVQISTDSGESWTSLAGRTSSTYVHPFRHTFEWVGEDLGAPAFTGDSRQFAPDGWILEQVPLPLEAGVPFRLRFNFGGSYFVSNEHPSQDYGWWIDDVYLGTASEPTRHLVSDFESGDVRRWAGLLTEFAPGGFAIVEETAAFPRNYFFELRGSNAHDEVAFREQHPKELTGRRDKGIFKYEAGVVGYFADQYGKFISSPRFAAGSATGRPVPLARERRLDICYPYCPGAAQTFVSDFGFALALASDPSSGFTIDDVVFFFTLPFESFGVFGDDGLAFTFTATNPFPDSVTVLDASPTYRPLDVSPALPETPFPERPSPLWPYVIGAPGGWPKSVGEGRLGTNDPTTTLVLGQPFLAHDAAFHPSRNGVFDDRFDYRGAFVREFVSWHAPSTQSAFGSPARAERLEQFPFDVVPISEDDFIQIYIRKYCPLDSTGECTDPENAIERPWLEQVLYERLVVMLRFAFAGGCPPYPGEVYTVESKPAHDAYNACIGEVVDAAHERTMELLEVAKNLGNNPLYSWLQSYGDQGTLSPALWAEFFHDAWTRAKGPAPLPSFGLQVAVESITSGDAPKATLSLRRSR